MTPSVLDDLPDVVPRLAALAEGPLAPEDALDPALRLVVEASGASAGAMCLFDARDGLLRLVAETGLSDEGCRQLRTVRSDGGGWSAPLESLLDGHALVIELAPGEGNVPTLVDPPASIEVVACLPIYIGDTPRGSIVLAGDRASLAEEALDALGPALEELTRIVEGIHHRPPPESMLGTVLRLSTQGASEVLGLVGSVFSVFGLSSARRGPEVEALLTERQHLLRAQAAATLAHEAELERWAARLAEAEEALAREQHRAVEQKRLHEQERQRSEADRDETVRRALELTAAADAVRAEAATEAEAIRAALAGAQRRMLEGEDETNRFRVETEELRAGARAALAERDRLIAALEATQVREKDAASGLARLEAELRGLREREAELGTREERMGRNADAHLAAVEEALLRSHERVAGLERDRGRLAAELDEAVAAERRIHAELDALVERTAADRDRTLRQARELSQQSEEARAAAVAELAAVRAALGEAQSVILHAEERGSDHEARLRYAAEANQEAEAARAAAVAELEAARAALVAAQDAALGAEDEARRQRGEAERLAAEHEAAVLERQRLGNELVDARGQLAEAASRVAQLEDAVQALRTEWARHEAAATERDAETERSWEVRLAALEGTSAADRTRLAELERELAQRTDELSDARAREAEARELLAAAERGAAERDETLRRTSELASATEAARAAAAAEMEAIRTSLANSQAFVLQLEDDARRARGEVERLAEVERALGAERQQLARALQSAREQQAARPQPGAARPQPAVLRQQALPPRREPVASASKDAPPAPAPGAPPKIRVVAVVDADASFASVSAPDVRLEVLAPAPDLAARLAEVGATRVLVNLAAPGALEALAELRADGCAARFWGFLAAPGAPTALSLGMIEPATRPLDAEVLLALLASYTSRGTRVLAVGAEADALISLRQALTRQGISLSIAWDEKQAADLLPMVRPDVVVVDLALPPRGGHGIVASLATLEQLPTAVLIPRAGEDAAAAFTAAAADRARQMFAIERQRMVQAVVMRSEERPTAPASRK